MNNNIIEKIKILYCYLISEKNEKIIFDIPDAILGILPYIFNNRIVKVNEIINLNEILQYKFKLFIYKIITGIIRIY